MSYADKMHRFAQETRQEEHDRASKYMKGFRAFAENVKSKPKEPAAIIDPRISAAECAEVLTEFRDKIKPPAELSAALAAHEAAQKNQTSGFLATLAWACGRLRPKKKEN